ncbi:hypothetical protein ScPMuIL_000920 [Solemya velum]
MADFDGVSFETFRLWSTAALKAYLALRKKSTTGTFDELVARAFCAWEEKVPVDVCAEHAERQLLEDYKKKLRFEGEILPDPFSLHSGWLTEKDGITKWPSVYFVDISNYLQTKNPQELVSRLMNEYKEGKAYRYFTCDWVKEVHFHPIRDNSLFCVLKADVCPSQKINNKPYQIWAIIKKDRDEAPGGYIVSAYCNCTAGMLGSCNHIAGMLFRVEAAVKTGMTKPTCTSQISTWNVPSKKITMKPLRVSDASWTKDHYKKTGSSRKPSLDAKKSFTPLTKQQQQFAENVVDLRKKVLGAVKKGAPNSCFVQLIEKKRTVHTEANIACPLGVVDVAGNLREKFTVDQLQEFTTHLTTCLQVSEAATEVLQKLTVAQSGCEEWKKQRLGRITASNFHRTFTRSQTLQRDPTADPSSLIASVMGYTNTPTTTAMKHGLSMEPHAKTEYTSSMKRMHKNFRAENVGIVLFKEKPYISASADLLTSCKCCGEGLCEIKCPETIKDQIPTAENLPYIDIKDDGELELKKNHSYYFQIQGQMGVLNRQFCDLFVYTAHGHMTVRIKFDKVFWCCMLEQIDWFWKNHISRELLTQDIRQERKLLEKEPHPKKRKMCQPSASDLNTCDVSCSKKRQSGLLKNRQRACVYLCGLCGQQCFDDPKGKEDFSIQCERCDTWIHFKCAGIKKGCAPNENEEWFCQKCKK